jgi:hypothetical protein
MQSMPLAFYRDALPSRPTTGGSPMFTPACLPILIGSLPLTDHQQAMRQVLSTTPEIPLWPQLPKNPKEGMLRQFLDGFPGLTEEDGRFWIATDAPSFAEEMTSFYEDALRWTLPAKLPKESRFSLTEQTAHGFFVLCETLARLDHRPLTVKGQVTGPITCGIGVKDQRGTPIFHDDNLRDMLIKLLSLKARWQVEQLRPWCREAGPLLFIDEPGMVSFGSTAFSGISRDTVCLAMAEMITAIKNSGGLAGIHICANGDWAPALQSAADIISFDAFSYFDNFILYRDDLLAFLSRGGILAWGIVPTSDPLTIAAATEQDLLVRWQEQARRICALGFAADRLQAQTLIAPACGTGSLPPELGEHVLRLTSDLARLIRGR